jgi:hypothetical protein
MYTQAELQRFYLNEQVLVVLLSRLFFSSATAADIRNYAENHFIDKKKFNQLTNIHGLTGFLQNVIQQNQLDDCFNLQNSSDISLKSQLKNLEQLRITHIVQNLLAESGIKVIPYKGAVFCSNYYPSLSLRESSDIDFIVPREHLREIEDFLIRKEFKPKTTVSKTYIKYYLNNYKDISYTAPGAVVNVGHSVEMHWNIVEPVYGPYASYDFFETGTCDKNLEGLRFTVLQPTYDFLAIASNHFIKDLGYRFKYIVDIGQFIKKERENLNNELISEVIKRYGFKNRIKHGGLLVEKLLGIGMEGIYKQQGLKIRPAFTLEYNPIKIKPSDPRFIYRSVVLHDSWFKKLPFVLRCIYYYILPNANDLNQVKDGTEIWKVALKRLRGKLALAFNQNKLRH